MLGRSLLLRPSLSLLALTRTHTDASPFHRSFPSNGGIAAAARVALVSRRYFEPSTGWWWVGRCFNHRFHDDSGDAFRLAWAGPRI